jgi:hypothetical protein
MLSYLGHQPSNRMISMRSLVMLIFICFGNATLANNTRTYFIAAEEVLWDYAPSYPINPMHLGEFSPDEKVFVEGDNKQRIGHRYYKARFIEYTDASFVIV